MMCVNLAFLENNCAFILFTVNINIRKMRSVHKYTNMQFSTLSSETNKQPNQSSNQNHLNVTISNMKRSEITDTSMRSVR